MRVARPAIPEGELLHCPAVAVWVTEEDERSPWKHLHVGDVDPAPRELRSGRLDVVDHELKAADRAGSLVGQAGAERDRARRSRRVSCTNRSSSLTVWSWSRWKPARSA